MTSATPVLRLDGCLPLPKRACCLKPEFPCCLHPGCPPGYRQEDSKRGRSGMWELSGMTILPGTKEAL